MIRKMLFFLSFIVASTGLHVTASEKVTVENAPDFDPVSEIFPPRNLNAVQLFDEECPLFHKPHVARRTSASDSDSQHGSSLMRRRKPALYSSSSSNTDQKKRSETFRNECLYFLSRQEQSFLRSIG